MYLPTVITQLLLLLLLLLILHHQHLLNLLHLRPAKAPTGDGLSVPRCFTNTNCGSYDAKKPRLSEVGFEPTPTEVDCDLNAAPWTARPS